MVQCLQCVYEITSSGKERKPCRNSCRILPPSSCFCSSEQSCSSAPVFSCYFTAQSGAPPSSQSLAREQSSRLPPDIFFCSAESPSPAARRRCRRADGDIFAGLIATLLFRGS